jgi:hypothetical protein
MMRWISCGSRLAHIIQTIKMSHAVKAKCRTGAIRAIEYNARELFRPTTSLSFQLQRKMSHRSYWPRYQHVHTPGTMFLCRCCRGQVAPPAPSHPPHWGPPYHPLRRTRPSLAPYNLTKIRAVFVRSWGLMDCRSICFLDGGNQ